MDSDDRAHSPEPCISTPPEHAQPRRLTQIAKVHESLVPDEPVHTPHDKALPTLWEVDTALHPLRRHCIKPNRTFVALMDTSIEGMRRLYYAEKKDPIPNLTREELNHSKGVKRCILLPFIFSY